MIKIKGPLLIALVAVLIQLARAGTGMAEVVDRIVAEVNNEIITMSELQNMVKTIQAQSGIKSGGADEKKMEREMLEALIDRKLAKAEANRRGIKIADKEVDEAMARFKQRNNIPDDETFAKGLSQAGLSLKEFRQQIADQMTQERLLPVVVGTKVMVSDADVRRLYDERFKKGGNQVHLITLKMPYPAGGNPGHKKRKPRRRRKPSSTDVKRGESLTEAAAETLIQASQMWGLFPKRPGPPAGRIPGPTETERIGPGGNPGRPSIDSILGRHSGEARTFEEAAPEIRRILKQQEME